jgi:nucleoside triphosphate pyrophosphatase
MARLILASASRTRIALLSAVGVDFEACSAPIDEREIEAPLLAANWRPADIALALAEAKALAVSRDNPQALVIGADQVLGLGLVRMTKPASLAAARDQLMALSGRTHALHNGLVAARGGAIVWRWEETALLTMRVLTPAVIEAYLARVGDVALASVGAYQIEGPGIQLFARIEGDYFAILGLPLLPLLAFLRREGVIP